MQSTTKPPTSHQPPNRAPQRNSWSRATPAVSITHPSISACMHMHPSTRRHKQTNERTPSPHSFLHVVLLPTSNPNKQPTCRRARKGRTSAKDRRTFHQVLVSTYCCCRSIERTAILPMYVLHVACNSQEVKSLDEQSGSEN
jgi:hypothetical protein